MDDIGVIPSNHSAPPDAKRPDTLLAISKMAPSNGLSNEGSASVAPLGSDAVVSPSPPVAPLAASQSESKRSAATESDIFDTSPGDLFAKKPDRKANIDIFGSPTDPMSEDIFQSQPKKSRQTALIIDEDNDDIFAADAGRKKSGEISREKNCFFPRKILKKCTDD